MRPIDADELRKNTPMWLDGTVLVMPVSALDDAPTIDAVEVRCNVGNWVYALWNVPTKDKYIIYCAEVKEIRIAKRNSRITTTYILEPIEYRGRKKEYRDDDFGKLVFINEEDAKVALEERRSDEGDR